MASQNDREMKIVILLLAAALLILGAVAVAAASDRTDRMPVAVFDLRRPHRVTVVRGSGAGNSAVFAVKAFVRA